jgi:hypothetical protein
VLLAVIVLSIAVLLIVFLLVLLLGGLGELWGGEAGAMSAGVMKAVLIMVALTLLFGPKFLMMMPVASAERGGPVHILARSWSLSSGHYLRLLGFLLLILVAAVVVIVVTQLLAGTLLVAAFGELRPLSLAALLYGLLFATAQAALAVVISVMLARIYVQLAGRETAEVSVPSSGT